MPVEDDTLYYRICYLIYIDKYSIMGIIGKYSLFI